MFFLAIDNNVHTRGFKKMTAMCQEVRLQAALSFPTEIWANLYVFHQAGVHSVFNEQLLYGRHWLVSRINGLAQP